MFSFKQQMRKYFTLIFVAISAISFAQFQDNVFEKDKSTVQQSQSTIDDGTSAGTADQSAFGVPAPGDQEEGPGNPGEPVPIDGYVAFLLLGGLSLIFYHKRKDKEVKI